MIEWKENTIEINKVLRLNEGIHLHEGMHFEFTHKESNYLFEMHLFHTGAVSLWSLSLYKDRDPSKEIHFGSYLFQEDAIIATAFIYHLIMEEEM